MDDNKLKHNTDGFLTGTPLDGDGNPETLSEHEAKALEIWKGIQGDTAAIRSTLAKQVSEATRPSATAPVTHANKAAAPSRKDVAAIATIVRAVSMAERPKAASANRTASPTATPTRGADGRFLPSDGARTSAVPRRGFSGRDSGRAEGAAPHLDHAAAALGAVADKIGNSLESTEQLDPSVQAASEVKSLVQPVADTAMTIGRGAFGLFGRRKEKTDERTATAAEQQVSLSKKMLKALRAGRTETVSANGGLLSGLFSGIGSIGSAVTGALGGVLGRIGAGIGGAVSGLVRAVPFLSKLAVPFAAIYSAAKSFGTSTEEYARRLGTTAGDSLVKDLGIRFVGVLGDLGNTLTFGLAGKFGDIIAPAFNKAMETVTSSWTNMTDALRNSALTRGVNGVVQKVTGREDETLGGAIYDMTHTDPKQLEKAKVGQVKTGNAKVDENWAKNGGAIVAAAKQVGIDPGTMAKLSRLESAGFDAKADTQLKAYMATGGKKGSTASGLYQFLDGTWAQQVAKTGSAHVETAGIVDSAKAYLGDKRSAFEKRNDPAYASLFQMKTYAPAAAVMAGDFTADNIKRLRQAGFAQPTAEQIYSMHMTGSTKAAIAMRKDPTADYRTAFSDAEIRNNPMFFKGAKTTQDVFANMRKELDRGEAYAVAATQAANGTAIAQAPQTNAPAAPVNAKATAAPALPTAYLPTLTPVMAQIKTVPTSATAAPNLDKMMPPAPPAPLPERLSGTGKDGKSVTVNIPREVGQNVADRGIAQVATGGLGGYMLNR